MHVGASGGNVILCGCAPASTLRLRVARRVLTIRPRCPPCAAKFHRWPFRRMLPMPIATGRTARRLVRRHDRLLSRSTKIEKSFGPVQVLHGISFDLPAGRVVGLLGENGAGKSTLMKILAGYEVPTGGAVRIDGEVMRFDGPRAAEQRGIVMIHQEFALAEDLTIAQNIFLGHEQTRGGWLRDAAYAGRNRAGAAAGRPGGAARHTGAPADRGPEAAGRDRQGAAAPRADIGDGRTDPPPSPLARPNACSR